MGGEIESIAIQLCLVIALPPGIGLKAIGFEQAIAVARIVVFSRKDLLFRIGFEGRHLAKAIGCHGELNAGNPFVLPAVCAFEVMGKGGL